MARLFDRASSEYLNIDQAVLSGYPLAMVNLFNTNDAGVVQLFIDLVDKDVDNQHHLFYYNSVDNAIRAYSGDASGQDWATSTLAISADTWYHGAALFVSATDRRILTNGAYKSTNATSHTPINLDRTGIGRYGGASTQHHMSGMIAEAAIYDLSVWPGATASDKADNFEKILPSLTKGFTPLHFPLGLVAYWPLIRGLNDKVSGFNLTASGTTVAAHPNIIQPCGVL